MMMIRIRTSTAIGLVLGAVMSSGCSSITGLDGASHYACKAPEGVRCDSVSGNYYNAIQNNLPSQRRDSAPTISNGSTGPRGIPEVHVNRIQTSSTAASVAPDGGRAYLAAPLRAGPRVLRLWIKPWEDSDRDLNGESLVYVQIDNGRWLVDHVQRQARQPFAPVRPTKLSTSAVKGSGSEASEAEPRSPREHGRPTADAGSSVTQALRSLQERNPATPGN